MTRYALYDGNATATTHVLGWYDTEVFDYGDRLPASEHLLELTDAQWEDRLGRPWGVEPGDRPRLVPFEYRVVLPPGHAAWAKHAEVGRAGVAVVSSDPKLGGVYGAEDVDVDDIHRELQFIASFGEFSGADGRTLPWRRADGSPVAFTSVEQFKTFAKLMLKYSAAARAAAEAEASGEAAAWPIPSITIP